MPAYAPHLSTWSWSEKAIVQTIESGESLGGGLGGQGREDLTFRQQLGDARREPGGIALEDQQADLVEGLLDPARIQRSAVGAVDLRRLGRVRALVRVEEVLVE